MTPAINPKRLADHLYRIHVRECPGCEVVGLCHRARALLQNADAEDWQARHDAANVAWTEARR